MIYFRIVLDIVNAPHVFYLYLKLYIVIINYGVIKLNWTEVIKVNKKDNDNTEFCQYFWLLSSNSCYI